MTKVYSSLDEGTDEAQIHSIKHGTLFVSVFHSVYRIELGGKGSSRRRENSVDVLELR